MVDIGCRFFLRAYMVDCQYMKSVSVTPASKKRYLIIGAGPCGLGAGWRLRELGVDNFVIYEKQSFVGGLAASYTDPKGFTWDVGGHVLHSHYPYFTKMFETVMKNEYYTHERESWVWMYNRFVPYPFQNNIHRLPKVYMDECLKGLHEVRKHSFVTPDNFQEWLVRVFGKGIARHFLLPYNRKVWAYPLHKMSYQWVSDRVSSIDISRIERNIRTMTDDISWGPNAVFFYPKHGGTGRIWKQVAKPFHSHIKMNKEVKRIDAVKKHVYFTDGSIDIYDALLTSMPLDALTRTVSGVQLPQSVSKLHHSGVAIVGIGIAGRVPSNLKTKCWMYFPESHVPFFRATVLSNYSKYNAPKGCWSVMVEISFSASYPLPDGGDSASLELRVIRSLMEIGFMPRNARIVDQWSMTSAYGYPTPTIHRDTYVDGVLKKLETYGISSRGRFGMWKYEISNQDHTFMQGVDWADGVTRGI